MKKTFKFFLMAAIVAAGFTACSSEEVNPGPDGGGGGGGIVTGEATSATFSFRLLAPAETKAVNPDNNENPSVTEFRVLIFNAADGNLEVDTARTLSSDPDSLLTIPLISGQKKIYVYANGGTTAGYLTTPAKGAAGFNNLSQINGVQSLVTGLMSPYKDLPEMHKLYPAGGASKFFYSSTEHESTVTLLPGISGSDSKDPSSKNFVDVQIDRPVAKVAVTKTSDSGPTSNPTPGKIITKDSAGTIVATSVQYKFWTVNVNMYPFQKTGIATPWYEPTAKKDPLTLQWYARELGQGTGTTNNFIPIPNRTAGVPAVGSYYYISENNPLIKKRGNTTIANVEAVFLPTKNHYVSVNASNPGSGINYNEALQQFTPYPAVADLGTASDMYLLKMDVNGMKEGTLLAGTDAIKLAKKVWYHLTNPTEAPKASLDGYGTVTDAQLEDYFIKYTGGKAYYRLEIGDYASGGCDRIVRRNWYYDVNITGFLNLGGNTPESMVEPEDETLDGPTNLSVHIIIRDWTGKQVGTDI